MDMKFTNKISDETINRIMDHYEIDHDKPQLEGIKEYNSKVVQSCMHVAFVYYRTAIGIILKHFPREKHTKLVNDLIIDVGRDLKKHFNLEN